MKHTRRPLLLSEHRLQRLSLWLGLTIAWFAARVLAHVAPRAARVALNDYARYARLLLLIRAVKSTGFRRGAILPDMRRLTCRAVAGGALRRALRTGPLHVRAGAVLAAPDRWIAHITKRLQRGFTRLRRLPAPHRTRPGALAAALCEARAINSSQALQGTLTDVQHLALF